MAIFISRSWGARQWRDRAGRFILDGGHGNGVPSWPEWVETRMS